MKNPVNPAAWAGLEGRARSIARVHALRAAGWLYREIAEETGIPRGTVCQYLLDPNQTRLRARQASYGGECVDCGVPTDGHAGKGKGSERCVPCAQEHVRQMDPVERAELRANSEKRYTDEFIFACMRAATGDSDRLTGDRYEEWRGGVVGIPSKILIVHRFDTWNKACQLAGLRSYATTRERILPEDCHEAVLLVERALGRFPSITEYGAYRKANPRLGLPSEATIRIRCGGWLPVAQHLRAAA